MNPILANKTSLTPPRFIDQSDKWTVIYLCARDIEFASFYDFFVGFWSRSDSVVFFFFFYCIGQDIDPPSQRLCRG